MRIELEPVDYWRVRALVSDVERATLEARALLQIAQVKQQAALGELSARYGFELPAGASLRLDDDTRTLTLASPERESSDADESIPSTGVTR